MKVFEVKFRYERASWSPQDEIVTAYFGADDFQTAVTLACAHYPNGGLIGCRDMGRLNLPKKYMEKEEA